MSENAKQLTDEQRAIIEHQGNARVNAVAGSGKTSTLIEYAKARPANRILYLAYNRSVKQEAIDKFLKAGCCNVQVETVHSLAYRSFNVRNRFTLAPGGNMRVSDIINLCNLRPARPGNIQHLILARHILRYLNLYLNSDVQRLADLDYFSSLTDPQAIEFVETHAEKIFELTWGILKQMYESKIPIVHDAYLKFWALTNPVLPHDIIQIDEGQDSNPVTLDLFLKQRGTLLTVGDNNQAIYRFRSAVNSLEKVDFPQFTLSRSFRFRQPVADLAMEVLNLKKLVDQYPNPVSITGMGDHRSNDSYAILARGNLQLLSRAIDFMLENKNTKMYFEGDLSTYTYMADGGSLYDILNLRMCQFDRIRSDFMKSFQNFNALLEYASGTNDQELSLMIEIVNKYGRELFTYINMLRDCQTERSRADVIFSTTHKAKGQEYSCVEICPDYITGDKIRGMLAAAEREAEKGRAKPVDAEAIAEECNLLYVAVTRVKNRLIMNFDVNESRMGQQRKGLLGFDPADEHPDRTDRTSQRTSKPLREERQSALFTPLTPRSGMGCGWLFST